LRSEPDMSPDLLASPVDMADGTPRRDLGGYAAGDERVIAVREGVALVARFAREEPIDA